MLFITQYKTSTSNRHAGIERFKATGGLPPAGVKLIARYHYADGSGGITISETDDPVALAKWATEWSDVLVMDGRPVLTDEQMAKVLGK